MNVLTNSKFCKIAAMILMCFKLVHFDKKNDNVIMWAIKKYVQYSSYIVTAIYLLHFVDDVNNYRMGGYSDKEQFYYNCFMFVVVIFKGMFMGPVILPYVLHDVYNHYNIMDL